MFGAFPFFIGLWLCLRAAWKARDGLQGVLPLSMLLCLLINNLKAPFLAASCSGLYWRMPLRAPVTLAAGTGTCSPRGNQRFGRPVMLTRQSRNQEGKWPLRHRERQAERDADLADKRR